MLTVQNVICCLWLSFHSIVMILYANIVINIMSSFADQLQNSKVFYPVYYKNPTTNLHFCKFWSLVFEFLLLWTELQIELIIKLVSCDEQVSNWSRRAIFCFEMHLRSFSRPNCRGQPISVLYMLYVRYLVWSGLIKCHRADLNDIIGKL